MERSRSWTRLAKLAATQEDQEPSLWKLRIPHPMRWELSTRQKPQLPGHPPDSDGRRNSCRTASYMSPSRSAESIWMPARICFRSGLYFTKWRRSTRIRRPDRGDCARAILHRTPTSAHELASRVPRSVEAVISRALEKDRTRRYQSASEIAKTCANPKRDQSASALPALFVRGGDVASARRIGSVEYWRVRNSVTLSPSIRSCLPISTIKRAMLPWARHEHGFAGCSNADSVSQSPGPDKLHETLHALNLPNDTKVTVSPELASRSASTRIAGHCLSSIMNSGNRYGIELQVIIVRRSKVRARDNEAETRNDLVLFSV